MDFWVQFWPQLVATIIGVGIGIPIALYIYTIQERNRRDLEKIEEEKRKEKILLALRDEIKTEKDKLDNYLKEILNPERKLFKLYLIRTETWDSFTDGGELEWIKDPELLEKLADTYFSIRNVNFIGEKLYDMLLTAYGSKELDANEVFKIQADQLGTAIEKTLERIEKTMELI